MYQCATVSGAQIAKRVLPLDTMCQQLPYC